MGYSYFGVIMTTYNVSAVNKKSVEETQLWFHTELKMTATVEITWRWGEFTINGLEVYEAAIPTDPARDSTVPFDISDYENFGDVACSDSCAGFIDIEDWPKEMDDDAFAEFNDKLIEGFDEDGESFLIENGWELEDTDYRLYGPLTVEGSEE